MKRTFSYLTITPKTMPFAFKLPSWTRSMVKMIFKKNLAGHTLPFLADISDH
jgi:hypothetical protein